MKHYPFPKIRQYHQVLKDVKLRHQYVGKDDDGNPVYDSSKELPTVAFVATVKLHGTNAAIVFCPDGNFYCQSREQIIDEIKDNAGFAHWVNKEGFKIKEKIEIPEGATAVLYGEWCGGPIQKGVAINQLPKMFVVFGLKFVFPDETHEWTDPCKVEDCSISVYNIRNDGTNYHIEVDLNRPDKAIEQMTTWVDSIDKVCPFGKLFDIEGHGEGLVFRPEGQHGYSEAFKVKGESHSKTKIKKLPTVDVERLDSILNAVELHCNEDRLEQAWGVVAGTPENQVPQKIADFIRWVVNDIWEEEGDSIRASDMSRKEIGAAVSKKAARWFQNKLKEV